MSENAPAANVHFVIRALGDYTRKLIAETTVGMQAEIYGPYGRFERPADVRREIWIAGGVGISPFISWLTDAEAPDLRNVTLFYFYTPDREFPSAATIAALVADHGASFTAVAAGPASTELADQLEKITASTDPRDVVVSFCGPKGLLDRVRAQLREVGIPESNLRYEHFEFR